MHTTNRWTSTLFAYSFSCWLFVAGVESNASGPEEKPCPSRGKKALESRAFNPAVMFSRTYDNLWKAWGLTNKPDDFEERVRERYGFSNAPYSNDKFPMGLRKSSLFLVEGPAIDCMACHGGSLFGKNYVGLGNSTMDLRALFDDQAKVENRTSQSPFEVTRVRGTVEAVAITEHLFSLRNEDLTPRLKPVPYTASDSLCQDVPAWWLLRKKLTMYHTGSHNARSARALMQFLLHPLNSPATIKREEPTFRDIRAYLLSLEPPKYPFPIEEGLASEGKLLFEKNCSKCHGTYGEKWTYPNFVVPLEKIGTDSLRSKSETKQAIAHYNRTWFAEKHKARVTRGYQAPPLDGIWATAPYFHNGSVPTVEGVLNSKSRPEIFTRSFGTDKKDYDPIQLGWKVRVHNVDEIPSKDAIERRKVYDTRLLGRDNSGHTFGDRLSPQQRSAVIEYLKTL